MNEVKIVPREVYERVPTLQLCRLLLGLELVHGDTAGRIVEVEAYMGPNDRAAHSYGGRRTKRTEVMFGPPGFAYVYISHGIHTCVNVVSGQDGRPEAILIRALEPTRGIDIMRSRRPGRQDRDLTNGPGKLCQALGITMDHYGWDLTEPPFTIQGEVGAWLHALGEPSGSPRRSDRGHVIESGPRIGIDGAGEARHYPWRFWIKGNPFVSR